MTGTNGQRGQGHVDNEDTNDLTMRTGKKQTMKTGTKGQSRGGQSDKEDGKKRTSKTKKFRVC